MYGLKGNIDATVQVACVEKDTSRNLVVPLELKTGKRDTNQAHRAQTALYTLLLSDRYGVFSLSIQVPADLTQREQMWTLLLVCSTISNFQRP